jgi:hypothetical protein
LGDLSTKYRQFPTKLNGFRALVAHNLNKTLKWHAMFYHLLGGRALIERPAVGEVYDRPNKKDEMASGQFI